MLIFCFYIVSSKVFKSGKNRLKNKVILLYFDLRPSPKNTIPR